MMLLMEPDNVTKILKKAREVYGHKNQILVCIEELNELGAALAKYPRYESEQEAKEKLHDTVLDEVADVLIILDHVQAIVGLTDEEIAGRICEKAARLERWLNNSSSMQRTLEDRAVGSERHSCLGCDNWENPEANMCGACMAAEATDGVRPFYKPRKD